MKVDIVHWPAPVLLKATKAVESVDDDLRDTARNMSDLMVRLRGVGLAAPQVGASRRLIVLDVRKPDEPAGKHLLKLVNPIITEREGQIVWEEGCLSVPDFSSEVTRAQRILDRTGPRDRSDAVAIDVDI